MKEDRLYRGKIVMHARQLKIIHGTDDPIEIARAEGVIVDIVDKDIRGLKACVEYINGEPHILINSKYTEESQKLLCAHELGHATFHPGVKHEYKNKYSGYFDSDAEKEADLFAVALAFPNDAFNKPVAYIDDVYIELLVSKNTKLK